MRERNERVIIAAFLAAILVIALAVAIPLILGAFGVDIHLTR